MNFLNVRYGKLNNISTAKSILLFFIARIKLFSIALSLQIALNLFKILFNDSLFSCCLLKNKSILKLL